MANVRKTDIVYEFNDGVEHEERQVVNTRVSHYLELYASGRINELPQTYLQENPPTPEEINAELLNGRLPLPELGTNPVEVMEYLSANYEKFEALAEDYNLAVADRQKYDAAMAVLDDENSTTQEQYEAMKVLDQIERRARARTV